MIQFTNANWFRITTDRTALRTNPPTWPLCYSLASTASFKTSICQFSDHRCLEPHVQMAGLRRNPLKHLAIAKRPMPLTQGLDGGIERHREEDSIGHICRRH